MVHCSACKGSGPELRVRHRNRLSNWSPRRLPRGDDCALLICTDARTVAFDFAVSA